MIDYKDFDKSKDVNMGIYRTKNGAYSDTIYTFDIETTSMFNINGKWQRFDKSITPGQYKRRKIKKACVPYIGMFGIEDTVYMFRDMKEGFLHMLNTICNPLLTKTVWVHNLGYEFAFYQWIFADFTICDMIARKARVPISFYIKELNIIFRCSLRLTELSLEKAAEQYTNIEKKSGDLDYNLIRSPLTRLSEKELSYCEYDILTLHGIVDHFRKEYKHIKSIPLTQTGEMRRAYKKVVPPWHNKACIKMIPSVALYKKLSQAFWGGIAHGNLIYIKEYLKDIDSFDISSSYPFAMCARKFPVSPFREVSPDDLPRYDKDKYAILYEVDFYNASATTYNTYIPFSKCISPSGCVIDNGRVRKGSFTLVITDIDFEIIKRAYYADKITILRAWVAKKGYLSKYFIKFLLDLYGNKTTLKGVEGQELIYQKKKELINSAFGAACTNPVKSSVAFDKGKWITADFSDEIIADALEKQRKGFNNLFIYSQGVWITAFSRERLFKPLLDYPELDDDVVYMDTDSHKIMNGDKHKHIYDALSEEAAEDLKKMCKHYNIDYELTRPVDIKGKAHPLGEWDHETASGAYSEFITLGAKRYAYRDAKGELHITVAGVGKRGVDALNDNIHNFNESTFWDYDHSYKLCHTYIEDQKPFTFTDIDGNDYSTDWQTGVVLEPTTYKMGLTPYFEQLIESAAAKRLESDDWIEQNGGLLYLFGGGKD